MFISRISIVSGKPFFDFIRREKVFSAYDMHQLLWRLFPDNPHKSRDFLFKTLSEGRENSFMLVSKREPQDIHGIFSIESKVYAPQIVVGEKLFFQLRANPVVAKRVEGRKNSVHHDVWMNAKKEGVSKGLTGKALALYIEKESKNWLIKRGEQHGFSLNLTDFIIDGYRQEEFLKRRGKRGIISFSSIDFEGMIEITDPQKFTNLLFQGIGKSKSFGCGMMMVRRA